VTGLAGVVLAAGGGTRLRPLTLLRPKALCPVGNETLVDRAIARISAYADEVAVNAHHFADEMVRHLDGRVAVSVEEPEALGTAGALGRLRDWIDGRAVLVTNADAYLRGPLSELVDGWDGTRARLLVVPVTGRGDFGSHRYVGACLLPWQAVQRLEPVSSGLYEVMWRDLWASGGIELIEYDGVAIDCGTPADYPRANLDASGGRSVIGAGAVVEGEVVRSVVWPGCRVAPGERLVEQIRADDGLTVDARQ
jgi:NDP-sugar pyrophosphorylase family protein